MEVHVLLPKVFNYPFTYIYKSQKIKSLSQGDFVIVPIGKKRKSELFGIKLEAQIKRLNLNK